MLPIEIALVVFACVFGAALLGMWLHAVLPQHHLREFSRDVIKLGMGLIATMAALVLGLVIATAKGSYDTQDEAIKHSAVKVLLFDHVLADYGPETQETRDLLRRTVAARIDAIWPKDRSQRPRWGTPEAMSAGKAMESQILRLSPQNDTQRWLQTQALEIARDIMETRWLVLGRLGSTVPAPFLVVVVFWLTLIFGTLGLLAPRNATVVTMLFLCAASVAGSIFLILELDQPFEGMIRVSSAPLRYALSQLGQ